MHVRVVVADVRAEDGEVFGELEREGELTAVLGRREAEAHDERGHRHAQRAYQVDGGLEAAALEVGLVLG